MDVVTMLRELSRYPLPDATYASVARVLVQAAADGLEPAPENKVLPPVHTPLPTPPSPAITSAPPAAIAPVPSPPGRQDFVRLTIRQDGRRTTACVPTDLFEEAVAVLGDSAAASEKVRGLYRDVPSDAPSKSGWVQEQLQTWLAQQPRDEGTADLFPR